MSNKAPVKGNAGLEEGQEVVLMGEDVSMLTPIASIGDVPKKRARSGRFKYSVSGATEAFEPRLSAGPFSNEPPPKPAVSRVMDANGHARITILLGHFERYEHLPIVVGLIDSASENDVVDITVLGTAAGEAGTLSQRSILSAIDRCKGTVITRAGALTTLGDVVIWLSGDQCLIPRMGAIFLRQPISGFVGDAADYESKLQDFRDSIKEFSDYVVERGLFTQEEINHMYESRGMLSLYGDALQERVKNLKPEQ